MKRGQRDVGASVRNRLLERARIEQSDFQLLLTRYVLERLLYRLSVSTHRNRFLLKGAMLLAVWAGDRFRPTRDLDLLGYGDSRPEALDEAFRTICAEPVVEDGVVFAIHAIEATAIREDTEYGGVRIRTSATVGGARIPVQVDIGAGDAVTPAPVEINYPVLLPFPAPRLRAYPVETVIAEKLEAIVKLGMANSRLKDYYDLWLISRYFTLDQSIAAAAITHTFGRRGTALPSKAPVGLTAEFAAAWQIRWRTFLTRERMAAVPEDLAVIVDDLYKFFMPSIRKANRGSSAPEN